MSYRFVLCDSLEKVFSNEEPRPAKTNHFSVLHEDTLHFQIASYLDMSADKKVGWEYSNLRLEIEADSVLKEAIRIFQVKNVPCTMPVFTDRYDDNYLFTDPRLVPDLLQETDLGSLRPVDRQWRTLWFELKAPDSLSGTYPMTFSFFDTQDRLMGQIQIDIEIIPQSLPKQKLIHTEWFHTDCLANYYDVETFSEEHWTLIRNFMEGAVRCGVNMILTPIFTPALDTAIGGQRRTTQLLGIKKESSTYHFDFSLLERWIDLALKVGMEYFEMAHFFTQWGAEHAPKIMVEEGGEVKQLFGWETDATSDAYHNFLNQLIPELKAFLTKRNLLEKTYFHISDEPHDGQLESYLASKNVVKDLLKDCHVIDALSSVEFYRQGVVEKPIPAVDHIEPFIEEDIEGLWTYYCCSQAQEVSNRFMAMPSARNRILGVLLYLYDIEGFLHWGFNFYNSQYSLYPINPYVTTDAEGAFQSGDAFLVYPGQDGHPMDSIRSRVFVEALQDLRALQKLEDLAGREEVEKLIYEGVDQTIDFKHYPKESDYILSLRDKVNRRIGEQ
jgi:hypothetical protein